MPFVLYIAIYTTTEYMIYYYIARVIKVVYVAYYIGITLHAVSFYYYSSQSFVCKKLMN